MQAKLKYCPKGGISCLHYRANPEVPDMTIKYFYQLCLPNSTRYIDDIILTHYSHLEGGTKN